MWAHLYLASHIVRDRNGFCALGSASSSLVHLLKCTKRGHRDRHADTRCREDMRDMKQCCALESHYPSTTSCVCQGLLCLLVCSCFGWMSECCRCLMVRVMSLCLEASVYSAIKWILLCWPRCLIWLASYVGRDRVQRAIIGELLLIIVQWCG